MNDFLMELESLLNKYKVNISVNDYGDEDEIFSYWIVFERNGKESITYPATIMHGESLVHKFNINI